MGKCLSVMSRPAARSRQGQANAEQRAVPWSDSRRCHLLLDAFISAPLRLSQQLDLSQSLGFNWNPDKYFCICLFIELYVIFTHLAQINSLSKLKYGHMIKVEKETARSLNESVEYMRLSNQVRITEQVVKQQIRKMQVAAATVENPQPEDIHHKAQYITACLKVSEEAIEAARIAERPSRNDAIIGGLIQGPGNGLNDDGAPNLLGNENVPPAAFPAAVVVGQLVNPVVVSRTSHSQQRRQGLISNVAGSNPPAMRARNADDMLVNFAEIQFQDAQYKWLLTFIYLFVSRCSGV
jgi:hypothetical protein